MSSSQFDIVIIGGGHNALAAAVHLSETGHSVAVFEQAPQLGGAVRTQEVTLPGYRHDLFAMNLSLFAGSAFAKKYGDQLTAHGLEYAPATHCFASPFPDGRWLGVTTDAEANARQIEQMSPHDADSWRALTAAFPDEAPHYFALLSTPMRALPLMKFAVQALRAKGSGFLYDMGRRLLSSPREFLDEQFTTPEVKALLAPWAMHLDFPPDASGGALFPYLEAMADQSFGMVLGKGGADVIPRALEGLAGSTGVTIHTSTPVEAIEHAGSHATGVRLEGGDVVGARTAVLASVTPHALLRLVGGSTGKAAVDRAISNFRHGPGTMMIHIAADQLPDWSAGDDLKRFAYVHLAPSMEGLSRTYQDSIAGILPAEPAIVVGQPTAIDPSRAPEGGHTLWLQVRVVPSKVVKDACDEIAPGDWESIKEKVADRVLGVVERYAPGFKDHILARTVYAPHDLERANPNLVG
ncbi:MAG: NAD(P)/FAD-dependent oxidoreductase, partial [Pseudomonadota bacterium]